MISHNYYIGNSYRQSQQQYKFQQNKCMEQVGTKDIPDINSYAPGSQRQPTIDEQPMGPSYPQSALQYLLYRLLLVIVAIILVVAGQSGLPQDEVQCIQDVILDWLQPITDQYNKYPGLGLTFGTISQLIADLNLIVMFIYWFIVGNSMRYPIMLAVIGVSKVLLNVLTEIKQIDNAFTDQLFFSFTFGQNFINSYFFSGVMCLLTLNLLEFYQLDHMKWFWAQIVMMAYMIFMLLSMRQNFFMDVVTAILYTHYTFYFVHNRIDKIDGFFSTIYDKITVHNNKVEKKIQQNEKSIGELPINEKLI